METRLGQAAPLVVAMEAILAACPLVADVEAVAEGTLGGPLMSLHAQKKPQLPSSPRRASCSCGRSCLSSPGGLSCSVCLALEGYPFLSSVSSPRGLLIPPDFPREFFFGGVKGVPAVGAGPRGPRPRPPKTIFHGLLSSQLRHGLLSSQLRHGLLSSQLRHGLLSSQLHHGSSMPARAPSSTMASWAPCTAMASRAPSSAMVPVCLFRSGGPRPVFLSVFVLRGLQSAHPPSPVELLRRGTRLPGGGSYVRVLLCVICSWLMCPYLVVSCPCSCHWVKYVPAVCLVMC